MVAKSNRTQRLSEVEYQLEQWGRWRRDQNSLAFLGYGPNILDFAPRPGMIIEQEAESVEQAVNMLGKSNDTARAALRLRYADHPHWPPQKVADEMRVSLATFYRYLDVGHLFVRDRVCVW